ncbi:MAG: D-alanine--D-alanine ligase [candidate division KSB1 bacterium]|nr:D-alanine--D-alanine ligase [candidate division KSB1 bacterium]
MAQKLRVGVLFGGRSTEHQVSLVSAQSVMAALDRDKYEVIPIGISPAGRWLCGDDALPLLKEGKEPPHGCFLPPDPTCRRLLDLNRLEPLGDALDVIFPVLHGSFGEDGTIQGLLELADIPYVGAGVLGSALAMDKVLQKLVCRQAGLPTVDFIWFRSIDWRERSTDEPVAAYQLANLPQEGIAAEIERRLGYPVFVKPPNLGSSVGISKAKNRGQLIEGIETALRYDRKVLVEAAVPDPREIEVAVLGNEHPRASIAGEIIPSNEFYDYDAKYVDGASESRIPADLPPELHESLRQAAVRAVVACEVEGMARVDFLVERRTGKFFLNEINSIPGFTSISMYPKLWEASGLSYPDLLDELIRLALDRAAKKRALSTTFQPKKEWYK